MPLEITKKSDSKIQAPKYIVDFDLDEDSKFKIPLSISKTKFFYEYYRKSWKWKK
jgi:hypothetical protein